MLKHTFQHIHGIGEKTEKRIWREGITSWETFLDEHQRTTLPQWQRDMACWELEASLRALERRDAAYFNVKLTPSLHWRLYSEFGQRIAYLDIETTGEMNGESTITVIGLYDGVAPRVYVQGQNLARFVEDIAEFTLLVTYNGKQFDLPVIRQELGAPLEQAHIDLRYPLATLGYKGGLKKIERTVGLEREGPLASLDGWCAVWLWRYHQYGIPGALETLLRYNLEDVIHLPALLALVYNSRIQQAPFSLEPISPSPLPDIPFGFDEAIIHRALADTGRAIESGVFSSSRENG
ncbi:MAG: ribonuclease H-like domain-containing protein [Candidatus Binatia bacterium]